MNLNPDALQDLYDACMRVLQELAEGEEISIGAQEDLQSAIKKAEQP